ncbi:MAG: S8 family serine peptidase [Acidobacteriota bacterium]|nr:S8 family serine peptidase [Acidobacteriota bacterium]
MRANLDVARAATNADIAWQRYGHTGRGVTVALIDSGLTPEAALPEERVLARVDFVEDGGQAVDGFGHGTHIAGIVAGDKGLAPEANLVVLRVLDAEGRGRLSDVLAAMDWVITHREEYGIQVVNLSLGYAPRMSFRYDPVNIAVRRAWAAGLTVVASAGNRGRDGSMTINAPGNDPLVITAGAMNDFNTIARGDDEVTTYSSRGPSWGDFVVKPDLVAPGNRIVGPVAPGSTLATEHPEKAHRRRHRAFRNQHGGRRRQRCRGPAPRAPSEHDQRRGQGRTDAFCREARGRGRLRPRRRLHGRGSGHGTLRRSGRYRSLQLQLPPGGTAPCRRQPLPDHPP